MKTTGVSDIPKLELLGFLGRPNVEDESETIEPFYPSKASDGLLAPDEGPGKIEHNKSDLRRSKLGGYYTKIDSGTAHSKYKCNISARTVIICWTIWKVSTFLECSSTPETVVLRYLTPKEVLSPSQRGPSNETTK